MDLHRLHVFSKVYELGSLSRSADAVFLSQPTVSGHIKSLEDELGVRLFDRLGRGVAPTQAAGILYGYAQRMLALREEALEAVAEASGRVMGRLAVGGSTIPGHYLLPAYLAQMRSRYPELTIQLKVADTRAVADLVEQGEVEMGIIGAPVDNPKLKLKACCADEMVLVAPLDSPLAGQAGPLTQAQVKNMPFIIREPGSGTRTTAFKALASLGLSLGDMNIVAELGSTQAVRQAVLAGLGGSIISSLAVWDDISSGRMVQLNLKNLVLNREFYLVSRTGRTLSPGAEKLAEMLMQEDGNDE